MSSSSTLYSSDIENSDSFESAVKLRNLKSPNESWNHTRFHLHHLDRIIYDLKKELKQKSGRIRSLEKTKLYLRERIKSMETRPCPKCHSLPQT